MVSAGGRPPGCVQPRPTMRLSCPTITQPTAGLGATRPSPRAARRSAWRIWVTSAAVTLFPSQEGDHLWLFAVARNFHDERFEILRFAEVLVDRRKADIG